MTGEPTETKDNLETKIVGMCSVCNLPVRQVRQGSLTSWIFRSSSCVCKSKGVAHVANSSNAVAVMNDTAFDARARPNLGKQFEVLKLLGSGGMGAVYLVKDSVTEEIRVIKLLHKEFADDFEAVKRFQLEAESVSQLKHKNIVAVHGQGRTDEGIPYLIMDFVDGTGLDTIIEKQTVRENEMLEIFLDLCEALSVAHEQGVIHRDLKPTNVIVTDAEDGGKRALLLDFGIAKVINAASSVRDTMNLTKSGDVFGTPTYMSPEQCLGFKIDQRSDIYSLGALMYEAVSGFPPFGAGNPLETIIKQISDPPKPFVSRSSSPLHKGLESVILSCLEKEPNDRYQTIHELSNDLQSLKLGQKVPIVRTQKEKEPGLTRTMALGTIVAAIADCFYLFVCPYELTYTCSVAGTVALVLPFTIFLFKRIEKSRAEHSVASYWFRLFSVSLVVFQIACIPVASAWCGNFDDQQPLFVHQILVAFLLLTVASCLSQLASISGMFFFNSTDRTHIRRIRFQFAFLFVLISAMYSLFLPTALIQWGKQSAPNLGTTILSTAVMLDDKNIDSYSALADRYLELNQPAKAIDCISDAFRKLQEQQAMRRGAYFPSLFNGNIDKSDVLLGILVKRAELYHQTGEPEKALADLDQVLKATDIKTFWNNGLRVKLRGDIYSELGDFKRAEDDYAKSIELMPSQFANSAYEAHAALLWRTGRHKEAIAELDALIDLHFAYRDSADKFILEKAVLLGLMGEKQKAQSAFQKVAQTLLLGADTTIGEREMANVSNYQWKSWKIWLGENSLMRGFAYHMLNKEDAALADLKTAAILGYKKEDLLKQFLKQANIKIEW